MTTPSNDHPLNPHEEALITSFISPRKGQRYLYLLAHPKRRRAVLRDFPHSLDLDPRYAHRVPTLPYEESVDYILATLKQNGAPRMCHVMAENELDGRDMELIEAVRRTVGQSFGTVISCIPGRLAYFEGEDLHEQYILAR